MNSKSKLNLWTLTLVICFSSLCKGQITYPQGGLISNLSYSLASSLTPEHGFLPGKKFPIYPLIKKNDFNEMSLKVILYDDRKNMSLNKINCSEIEITNQSELNSEQGTSKVLEYIHSLFLESNIKIDSSSTNELEIRLTALDCRLIGFGQVSGKP